ncbi:SAM-dependent methyltransferase [Saccharomonospora piscinae]|uniref:SAM-dependent methyltransferase n=1 Tax=Saccharomonospora piscinae TaxID=687388 RepID=A0A1V8ZXY1_SACPI|nr:methyltransferase domain-containing protein [Saccharomonospora piscinae]OQO89779.1 SAM-dependent methyltransferase [Saccharomonospora piscinae]
MVESVRELGKFLSRVVPLDPELRVRQLYGLAPVDLEFAARSTTYMNYGYWEDGCADIDEAGEAMARLLGDAAGITRGDTVLDVGFGHGDQDFLWLRERDPARVLGLNITPSHVASARARAEADGVADRLDFREGSATEVPFPDGMFDRVVALECAFHFRPRTAFLAESFRVLRPGGTLAVLDVLPVEKDIPQSALRSPYFSWVNTTIDAANWHDGDEYRDRLAEAGYTDISLESIRDRVYQPYRDHMVNRLSDPGFVAELTPEQHEILVKSWSWQQQLDEDLAKLDYVLVVARKPG